MQITSPRRFVLFLLCVLLVIAGSMWVLLWRTRIERAGELEVASGQSAQAVWSKAVSDGFTTRALPWKYYAWRLDAASALKAGKYRLESGEKIPEVIDRMVRGDVIPDELRLTFPEGFALEQIAARVSSRGLGTTEAFAAAAVPATFQERFAWLRDLPAGRNLEGYLFPDTYHVRETDTPQDIIGRMLATFDQKFADDLRQEAATSGRTLDQIVIMASIIEREVLTDDDMALVSGVLWKRFDEGMGLDADATVRYALKKWDGALTVEDLRIDSPYNTRRYRGLPPGPISNPGLRALVAAVRPEASDYYYYLSTPEGETIFAPTNDEHNANKAKYLR